MTLEHVEAVATVRRRHPRLGGEPRPRFRAPLPWFQLSDLGSRSGPSAAARAGGGTGAGGGSGRGMVTYDTVDPPSGSVLVTTTLSPGLGPLLPRLHGIVSETGRCCPIWPSWPGGRPRWWLLRRCHG